MCVVAQKSRNNNTSTTRIVPPSSTTRKPHWASNMGFRYLLKEKDAHNNHTTNV